jgi:hypothetical protein
VPIEAEDYFDAVFSHNGKVDGVSRRQIWMTDDDVARTLDGVEINGQNLVYNFEQYFEARLNSIATTNRDVPVKDLLQDFRVGNESPPFSDSPFEQPPGVYLVRVFSTNKVHRDV